MKKYLAKSILFLLIIIFSGFFVRTVKAEEVTVCGLECGPEGSKTCITITTTTERVTDEMLDKQCVDSQPEACPTPCPPVVSVTTPEVTIPVPAVSGSVKPDVINLQNPLDPTGTKGEASLNLLMILGDITNAALGIIGSITLLVFAYGGFMWLTAAGNAENVKKGSTAMMWAIIGLFIVFGSYVILETVIKGLGVK